MISIVTPCFNEEDNVEELYERIRRTMDLVGEEYEHIVIDNSSTDDTFSILENLASNDQRLKLIRNARNFGHVRSPYHGLLSASGDVVLLLAADLQDPPELIPELLARWSRGAKVVLTVKPTSKESWPMQMVRKFYYSVLSRLADVPIVRNATGAGLYDRVVIEHLRKINDPYPYLRGLVVELGFSLDTVPFDQPRRKRGLSKNNFFTLYDLAMLGITSHSKVPLRIMTISGFILGTLSLVLGLFYFFAKVFFWDSFQLGIAPLILGVMVFSSVQLVLLGVIGEYVGAVLTQVRKLPYVVEERRVNF